MGATGSSQEGIQCLVLCSSAYGQYCVRSASYLVFPLRPNPAHQHSNPLMLITIRSHDVNLSTRLVIQVFHKGQTKKKHRKRSLVGSASVSLSEFLNKYPLPHPRPVEYDVRLACPPPQRKSPTIGGKQQHSATLTMWFMVPPPESVPSASPPFTPISERHEADGTFSDVASSTFRSCFSIVARC